MTTPRPNPITLREIDRDQRIVACDLLRRLLHLVRDSLDTLLVRGASLDPFSLQDALERLAHASRGHARDLNDARINRRAETPQHRPDPQVPGDAQPFGRHGAYRGSYASPAELAQTLAHLAPDLTREHLDETGACIALHLRGKVWTIDTNHEIHVFEPEGSSPQRDKP